MKKFVFIAVLAGLVAGCVTPPPLSRPAPANTVARPQADMAQVVFLRPSGVMGPVPAFVFEITDQGKTIIGVAQSESKFVVDMASGRHRLLSTNGMPGHIMEANLAAGKRYYVVIRPIYAHGFQLRPMKHDVEGEFSLENPELEVWKSKTAVVVTTPAADQWYESYRKTIDELEAKAVQVWNEKDDAQRAQLTLLPEDAEKN